MNRAYSLLTLKGVDEEKRIITGVASSPEPDRLGDIVEPLGIKYKNPMPLLRMHDTTMPVGTVKFEKPTKNGVNFEARLPKIDEPGLLKDRIDMAWQEVKAGLVRAVSIGFRPLNDAVEFMKGGGIRFLETEVLELSLVPIPANADATILQIKSIDTATRAASGIRDDEVRPVPPPGVTGKSKKPVKLNSAKEAKTVKKNIAEQISAFQETRQAKSAEMDTIMDAAAEKGETLDAAQKETYDTLASEVKEIDDHLVRLRDREKTMLASAKAASGNDPDDASRSRIPAMSISVQRNVPKGTVFTRLVATKWLARESGYSPIEIAKARFGDTPEVEAILRTAVAAGNTTDATWASPLVQLQNATNEFLDLLRPATIIGRIPGLMRVPFNVRVPRLTTDPTAYWVGEGKIKPVSAAAFDSVTLTFAKVAGIVPITEELARFSTPAAEPLLQNALIRAVTYLTDRTFVDPTAASTDVSPASITYGVSAVAPTGTTADAFRDDLGTLLANYAAANMPISGLVLIMTSQQAVRLSMMRNSLGVREFPDIGQDGGSVEGFTVITSENIPAAGGSPTDGYPIIAVHASSIMIADDGQVTIDMSREASLLMDTSPDSPETTSSVPINMWQHNMVAIKAERFITWKAGRTGAVQLIQGANYK